MTNSDVSRRHLLAAMGACAFSVALPVAGAQGAKSLTWLVGQPAGGTTDVVTRALAEQLRTFLGQQIIVENRAGASGAIALQLASKATPDGQTLITIAGPNLSNIPTPEIGKGLDGVAMVGSGPLVLVGTKARPMPPTLHDLLAQERAHPNAFSFASSGTGTIQHLAGALLNEQAGTRFTHIPYKGGAPAVVDVIGGQVALGILGAAPLLPHIKAGRLLVYGATSASRSPVLPDVPTLSELGLTGFSADQWYVVGTPAGTPAKRIQEVNAAISKALQSAELKSLLANAGVEPGSAWAPARVTEFVSTDLERWRALAKRAHIDLG